MFHIPLRLPEQTKKPKSKGCVCPLRSGSLATLRFGSKWKEERKKDRLMPNLVATTSDLTRTPFAPKFEEKEAGEKVREQFGKKGL